MKLQGCNMGLVTRLSGLNKTKQNLIFELLHPAGKTVHLHNKLNLI